MDNIVSISLKTPRDIQGEIAARFKARRLALNLTQEGLARRAGVSWGSLKRFERTGMIALESLLRLALVLDCLADFDVLCPENGRGAAAKSLDELLAASKKRKKGSIQ